jgi:hypothetical protein
MDEWPADRQTHCVTSLRVCLSELQALVKSG